MNVPKNEILYSNNFDKYFKAMESAETNGTFYHAFAVANARLYEKRKTRLRE
jgi:hypothetical protein